MATNQEKNKERVSTPNQPNPMEQKGRSESEKTAGNRNDEDLTKSTRTGSTTDEDMERDEENRETQRGDRGNKPNR